MTIKIKTIDLHGINAHSLSSDCYVCGFVSGLNGENRKVLQVKSGINRYKVEVKCEEYAHITV